MREGASEAGTKTYNIKPAVMAGTFGTHLFADTYLNSTGFPHVVSMHSANLMATVQMRNNFAKSSVLRIIDATASVYNTTIGSNQVMGGSVVQGDSFKGRFEQVGAGLGHLSAVTAATPALVAFCTSAGSIILKAY